MKKAYQLIEELMLLANELVARHLTERGFPRSTASTARPTRPSSTGSRTMCEALGIEFDLERRARIPKKLSALLKRVAEHPIARRASTCSCFAR